MLKLQRPHSMPHAVSLPQPLDCLSSQPKAEQSLPPLGPPHELQRLSNNSRLHTLPAPKIPANMSLAAEEHGQRHSGNRLSSHANGNVQPHIYSMQQAASQSSRAITSRPPSPISQLPTQDSLHRRKTSNNAIATQLQIPRTISTPQTSLLQLAAEVSSSNS
jgi:hypothetical protein